VGDGDDLEALAAGGAREEQWEAAVARDQS